MYQVGDVAAWEPCGLLDLGQLGSALDRSCTVINLTRGFAEKLVRLRRFLAVWFLCKTNPNPRNNIAVGKKWPTCHFLTSTQYFFLGWVGLWLGSFVGFMIVIIFYVFQTNIIW